MIALYIAIPIIVILGVWILIIAPGSSKGMDKFKCVKYAHRGLHGDLIGEGYAAENSLTAFERACRLGFGIELDVQLTRDGELVVFHDNTVDRVTGATGKVKDMTFAELRTLKLSGTDDIIPTFREVLDLVAGRVPLVVEMKETGLDHSISEETAKILKDYKGDFVVESFSPLAFGAIRREMPDALCGFLADKHTAYERSRTLLHRLIQRCLLNFKCRPAFIALNRKTPKLFPIPLIKALFKTPMIAWTVKSEAEEMEAYENDFDGIIFEQYIPKKEENK